MKCPACGRALQTIEAGGVSVEVCKGGCGGLWFDSHELSKFDEPQEAAGEALLDVPRDEKIKVDHVRKRSCPKCDRVMMLRRFFNVKRQVEIDECPRCAGVWLDSGELGTIRRTHMSPQEMDKAVQEYFREVLGADLAGEHVGGDLGASHRITRVFRFLTPRSRFWH